MFLPKLASLWKEKPAYNNAKNKSGLIANIKVSKEKRSVLSNRLVA